MNIEVYAIILCDPQTMEMVSVIRKCLKNNISLNNLVNILTSVLFITSANSFLIRWSAILAIFEAKITESPYTKS